MTILNDRQDIIKKEVIPAKVPILRLIFAPMYGNIIADINVNNSVAIRNTHLLSYYAQCKKFCDFSDRIK
jgi:poly(A) RNA polymerase GLD2